MFLLVVSIILHNLGSVFSWYHFETIALHVILIHVPLPTLATPPMWYKHVTAVWPCDWFPHYYPHRSLSLSYRGVIKIITEKKPLFTFVTLPLNVPAIIQSRSPSQGMKQAPLISLQLNPWSQPWGTVAMKSSRYVASHWFTQFRHNLLLPLACHALFWWFPFFSI